MAKLWSMACENARAQVRRVTDRPGQLHATPAFDPPQPSGELIVGELSVAAAGAVMLRTEVLASPDGGDVHAWDLHVRPASAACWRLPKAKQIPAVLDEIFERRKDSNLSAHDRELSLDILERIAAQLHSRRTAGGCSPSRACRRAVASAGAPCLHQAAGGRVRRLRRTARPLRTNGGLDH